MYIKMNFSEEQKLAVWERATKVDGYDPRTFRKDACGAWMIWDKYGDRDNFYGWEIDHIIPVNMLQEKGVDETLINDTVNLRALQWQNNVSKGDDYPNYMASVVADGNKNVEEERPLSVNEKKQDRLNDLFKL